MLAIENVHDLEILRAAANEGSFSAAARALDITQPAVSQAVARLERQLGVTLFNRQESGRGDFLTDEGAVLLAHAITALDELSDALIDLAELGGGSPLRVGLPAHLARHYFPERLAELSHAHSARPVEIVLLDTAQLIEEMRLHHVDVGIVTSSDEGMALPRVTFSKVASFPLVLAVREEDRPARSSLAIETLAKAHVPVIAFAGDTSLRTALDARLEQKGLNLNIVAETDQPDMLRQLVLAGMGVGIGNSLVFEDAAADIALLEPRETDLPQLNVFVFEDVTRARGPERTVLTNLRRQLFDAVRTS